jgi:hypothetical protein
LNKSGIQTDFEYLTCAQNQQTGVATTYWFPETDTWDFGGSAVPSGDIGGNQATLLQTTVTGPGTLSFWWKVSSEAGNDFLDLFVDSENPAQISGEIDWVLGTPTVLNSAKLYELGLVFALALRPVACSLTTLLKAASLFAISGSGFLGLSEASGGDTNSSLTNYL